MLRWLAYLMTVDNVYSDGVSEQRQRDLALAAWWGGLFFGPIVAIAIFVTGRHDPQAWNRGYVRTAVLFWTLLVAAYASVLFWDIFRRPNNFADWGPSAVFLMAWGLTIATALSACAFATFRILRRSSGSPNAS